MPDNSAAQVEQRVIAVAQQEPYGVRGWLLFFCVSTGILTPLLNVRVLFRTTSLSGWTLLSIGIAVFSVIVGINLWMVTRRAIAIVRAYFIFVVVFELYSLVYDLATQNSQTFENIMQLRIRASLYAVAWGLYFNRSKRVKNTYGSNL